jgi:hypothetical protein
VEAISWGHSLENTSDPSFQQRGQRIIVYPKFLTKFDTVLTTENVGLDMDGGHDIAYERIMAECQYLAGSNRPLFMQEDSEAVRSWPVLAEKVSIWMEEAKRIAVGGYDTSKYWKSVRACATQRATPITAITEKIGVTPAGTHRTCLYQTGNRRTVGRNSSQLPRFWH